MKKLAVNELENMATITVDNDEEAHAVASRITDCMLLVAKNVTTQEVGNTVFVTWEPWDEPRTDMTADEALEVAVKGAKKEFKDYAKDIQDAFDARKIKKDS